MVDGIGGLVGEGNLLPASSKVTSGGFLTGKLLIKGPMSNDPVRG